MVLLVCGHCLQQLLHLLLVLWRDPLKQLVQGALLLHRRHRLVSSRGVCLLLPPAYLLHQLLQRLGNLLLLRLLRLLRLLLLGGRRLLLVELLRGCLLVCLLLLLLLRRRRLGLCLLPATPAGGGGCRALPLHLLHPLRSGRLAKGRCRLLPLAHSRCQLAVQRHA